MTIGFYTDKKGRKRPISIRRWKKYSRPHSEPILSKKWKRGLVTYRVFVDPSTGMQLANYEIRDNVLLLYSPRLEPYNSLLINKDQLSEKPIETYDWLIHNVGSDLGGVVYRNALKDLGLKGD